MKILIVTQVFWPEVFRINDLAIALKEKGHIVEVLTGKPNYPKGRFYESYSFFSSTAESWNGIKIHRAPLIPRGNASAMKLAVNYLSFALFGSLRSLFIRGDIDRIFVFQPSPITVGIPALLLKWRKKAPVYLWVQDLWPHSVTAATGIKNKPLISCLDLLTRIIYKGCDKILIQSNGFKKVLTSQGVNSDKIAYFPNSAEPFFEIKPIESQFLDRLPKGFVIMFAGNIGESQDFSTIIQAAKIVKEQNCAIKWVILGHGRKYDFVREKITEFELDEHLFLLGSFPVEQMPYFFACADCLLVSLKKEHIFSLTIPSKIQSYLACGKPILASIEGEGARIVEEAEAGIVSNPEDPEELAKTALRFASSSSKQLEIMGKNSRAYFEKNFERESLLNRLEGYLSH